MYNGKKYVLYLYLEFLRKIIFLFKLHGFHRQKSFMLNGKARVLLKIHKQILSKI